MFLYCQTIGWVSSQGAPPYSHIKNGKALYTYKACISQMYLLQMYYICILYMCSTYCCVNVMYVWDINIIMCETCVLHVFYMYITGVWITCVAVVHQNRPHIYVTYVWHMSSTCGILLSIVICLVLVHQVWVLEDHTSLYNKVINYHPKQSVISIQHGIRR